MSHIKTTSSVAAKIKSSLLVTVCLSGLATFAGALNPSVAPGGNFNLSNWQLQEPILSNGSVKQVNPSQLVGAKGYTDKYFFTDSKDGAMSFFTPENGAHTPNSNFPRSELRELNSNGSGANWAPTGTNTLSATLTVTKAPGAICIGQIHIGSAIKSGLPSSTKPLLEIFYHSTGAIDLAIEQTPAGGNEVSHTIANVPLGTKFSYVLTLSGNGSSATISLSINGVTSKFPMPSSFEGYGEYFKAGDYLQTTGSSSTVGGLVKFYALKVTHN